MAIEQIPARTVTTCDRCGVNTDETPAAFQREGSQTSQPQTFRVEIANGHVASHTPKWLVLDSCAACMGVLLSTMRAEGWNAPSPVAR